jgi:hypothetical protein
MTEYLERVGDARQLLRVVLNKGLGRFHSFTGKHVLQFQGIYRCLSLEMIVCDDVGFVRLCSDLGDPFFPALEFSRLVQIV